MLLCVFKITLSIKYFISFAINLVSFYVSYYTLYVYLYIEKNNWKGKLCLNFKFALLPISEFVLDKKFKQNASILYAYENPKLLFPFIISLYFSS